jgi:chromate reductase, NAD(P)H dehydrogenase (quinone)
MPHHVAVLVGSLRQNSLSGRLAESLIERAPHSLQFERVAIGALPLYNEDLEHAPPPEWSSFRASVRAAAAVLFVTPEYNRSVPGGLKNAIDVGSRPIGRNVFANKPVAIVSQSPGAIGGFGAAQAIRGSLASLNVALLPNPEMYLSAMASHFDQDGKITDEGTVRLLDTFLWSFDAWLDQHLDHQSAPRVLPDHEQRAAIEIAA